MFARITLREVQDFTKRSGPVIELVTKAGTLDLHNFADFDGFEFRCSGKLCLYWVAAAKRAWKLGAQPIRSAAIIFYNVTQFSVASRDSEMPLSEDRTLEHYEISAEGKSLRFLFSFHGGVRIEVLTEFVDLDVEYDD